MKRTSAVIFSLVLLIALAACGGDDSDDDASAPTTEAAATTDETTGDDEGSPGGVCDEEDALTALDDALSGDVPDFDAASAAIDELAAADDGALEEPLETLGDGVDRISGALDGVDLEDDQAVDEALADVDEEDRAAIGSASDEIQAYVSDTCGLTIGTEDGSDASSDGEAGEADPPPSIDDAELEALAQECFDGSGGACDDLFFRADVDSEAEEYGNTCGGRFDESPGLCSTAIGE